MATTQPHHRTPTVLVLAAAGGLLALSGAGAGYAAGQITSADVKDNSLKGVDIKNGSLTGVELKPGSVNADRVKANSLTGGQVMDGSLRRADLGLASGERMIGIFATTGASGTTLDSVDFPVPAPTPVDSAHVAVVGENGDSTPAAGCTGTAANPVSARGYVCVYPTLRAGSTAEFGWGVFCGCGDPHDTGDGSRYGFLVQAYKTGAAASDIATLAGAWVYTAP